MTDEIEKRIKKLIPESISFLKSKPESTKIADLNRYVGQNVILISPLTYNPRCENSKEATVNHGRLKDARPLTKSIYDSERNKKCAEFMGFLYLDKGAIFERYEKGTFGWKRIEQNLLENLDPPFHDNKNNLMWSTHGFTAGIVHVDNKFYYIHSCLSHPIDECAICKEYREDSHRIE